MINTTVGAGAASRYGSGFDQKMRLLAAPAPQHCFKYLKASFLIAADIFYKPIFIFVFQCLVMFFPSKNVVFFAN
jgi:hypothetical protein